MAFMGKGLGDMRDAVNKGAAKLKIDSGKSVEIRVLTPMDEIISIYEHTVQIGGKWKTITCLGRQECPLCLAGERASFKAYINVLDRSDNKVKYWKIGKKVALQLLSLVEEYGDLSGRDFKVYRQGEKLDTTYQFFPRDPKPEDLSQFEQPNLEEMVAPMTREAILTMMSGGLSSSSDDQGGEPAGDGAGDTPAGQDDYPF
jgi:hypothetical protein